MHPYFQDYVHETTVGFMAQSSDFKQLPLVLNALASTPQCFLALSHCLMSICVISLKANQRIIISRQSILVSFSSLSLSAFLSLIRSCILFWWNFLINTVLSQWPPVKVLSVFYINGSWQWRINAVPHLSCPVGTRHPAHWWLSLCL